MKFSIVAAASLAASTPVSGEVFLKEQFNDKDWSTRWTESTKWKPAGEMGKWAHSAGDWYGGDASDKGIQTSEDAKFYGISAPLSSTVDNVASGKDLVIQYTVKHNQKIDCGGAYLKLLPGGDKFDAAKFGGDTPYGVMFGPDICGNNKRTHVILNYEPKEENLMIKKDIRCETDQMSHLYTLVIKPDNTFEVLIDNKSVREGKLEDEFDFLPEKEIKDPAESKPADWVDEKEIPDPESVKPEGYDDIPAEIPDPEATKPEDWDDEDDGEWEPPMIDNPDYKGEWKPKMIPNPDYKGEWVHPMIPNPEYKYDDKLHGVCAGGCTHVGFELWQVKSGTIFDDIIITDSVDEALKFAEETFFAKKDGEKEMYDKIQEEEAETRRNEAEAAADDDDEDDFDIPDLDEHDEF